MLAAMLEEAETLYVVIPEMAPLTSALPVMAKVLLPTQVALFVTVAAVIDTAPNGIDPPTAPVKVTVPAPAAIVNARLAASPLSVPSKLTLLLVVVSVIGVADRVTLPLYVCVPVVVTFAIMEMTPVLLKVRLPLVVRPTVFTVPMAKPLFSKKETVPVLPAKVVMAFEALVKV